MASLQSWFSVSGVFTEISKNSYFILLSFYWFHMWCSRMCFSAACSKVAMAPHKPLREGISHFAIILSSAVFSSQKMTLSWNNLFPFLKNTCTLKNELIDNFWNIALWWKNVSKEERSFLFPRDPTCFLHILSVTTLWKGKYMTNLKSGV